MKFVERCKRITATRIESFLRRAPDPEVALPRLEEELEANARTAEQAEAKARASVRSAQEKLDEATGRIARLEKGAVLALERGEEELAREILAEQVKTDRDVRCRREQLDLAVTALDDVRNARSTLLDQLADLRRRKTELLARACAARSGVGYAEAGGAVDEVVGGILEQVARMEGDLNADEHLVRIRKQLGEEGGSIDERLRRLEHDTEVEKRLDEMKKPRGRG